MYPNSTTPFVESLASSQETAFLGYPASQDLISTADAESELEQSTKASEFQRTTQKPSNRIQSRPAGSVLLGLDLGASRTCVQVLSDETAKPLYIDEVPTVVGFEECRVTEEGTDFKGLVALGASVAARQAEERQWQNLLR